MFKDYNLEKLLYVTAISVEDYLKYLDGIGGRWKQGQVFWSSLLLFISSYGESLKFWFWVFAYCLYTDNLFKMMFGAFFII